MRPRKSRTSSSAKALASDSIGTRCCTLPNFAWGAAPTRCDGESRQHQFGKALLDRRIALAQRVIVGIRNGRRIFRVIALVMLGNLCRKPRQFRLGLIGQHSTGQWDFAPCLIPWPPAAGRPAHAPHRSPARPTACVPFPRAGSVPDSDCTRVTMRLLPTSSIFEISMCCRPAPPPAANG